MSDLEARFTWNGHETWYRVVGELDGGSAPTPVVICHGGPGAAHDYTEPIAELSRFGRACVLYDQLGCGKSEHLPTRPPGSGRRSSSRTSWSRSPGTSVSTLGTPSSGNPGAACSRWSTRSTIPKACAGIVVADSPASMTLWVSEANRLREDLPAEVQATLTRHEQAGTTDDPEYEAAVRVFYDRHLCRVAWPDCVQRSFDQMDADPTVYHTMNGPSEFHVIGTLKGWDITDRLHEITTPTLLVSGRYDEATPADRRADPRAHPRRRVDDLRGLEPHAARRGAGGVPRASRGLPADDRLTQ